MAGSKSSPFSSLSALAKYVQYDLFDAIAPTLIALAPQTELPQVLARHPHGVQLGEHFVPYQLQRSKRRSIGFQITHSGLLITAPRWVSLAEINSAIVSKQRWILKNLQEQRDRARRVAAHGDRARHRRRRRGGRGRPARVAGAAR